MVKNCKAKAKNEEVLQSIIGAIGTSSNVNLEGL
jgi:hypothetical protein